MLQTSGNGSSDPRVFLLARNSSVFATQELRRENPTLLPGLFFRQKLSTWSSNVRQISTSNPGTMFTWTCQVLPISSGIPLPSPRRRSNPTRCPFTFEPWGSGPTVCTSILSGSKLDSTVNLDLARVEGGSSRMSWGTRSLQHVKEQGNLVPVLGGFQGVWPRVITYGEQAILWPILGTPDRWNNSSGSMLS